MTITAWRIVKRRYQEKAFTGEGARQYGGRWNSPGRPVIYTSQSASLAVLELLVHLGESSILPSYSAIPVTFDDSLARALAPSKLPRDWRRHPAPFELKRLGDEWLGSLSSPVLKVPSAIVPIEFNYLLNPLHPEFPSIAIARADALAFDIDSRLLKLEDKRRS